ncbi:hypothetical protein L5515_016988 [Caenorhabditis briggsae]|uniref:Uncharacterized protein n=1 Tax=Caenorhabditis briggsae TaxID=6238 RepID=A0AAE9FDM3_CAEBR|nr:hypothetical protein L5515_016988 [Caenorhabditis briggsae]
MDKGWTTDGRWTDNGQPTKFSLMDNREKFVAKATSGQRTDNKRNFLSRTTEKNLFRWTRDGQPMNNKRAMDNGPIFLLTRTTEKNFIRRRRTDNGSIRINSADSKPSRPTADQADRNQAFDRKNVDELLC